jgi:hypothetical protein
MIHHLDIHRITGVELTPIEEKTLPEDIQRGYYRPKYFIRKIILRDEAGAEMEINIYSDEKEGLIPIIHD